VSDEPFLARWSRRKREAEKEAPQDLVAKDLAGKAAPDSANPADAELVETTAVGEKIVGEPPFDIASLPPIESIGVGTDIRAFLVAGVPAEIKRAALRRVWVADPAIRDFVGLAENDWDFTKPDSMRGFGELAPDFDVEAMVRGVFGDAPERAEDQVAANTEEILEKEPAQSDPQPDPAVAVQSPGSERRDDVQSPGVASLRDLPDSVALPSDLPHRDSLAAMQTQITHSHPEQARSHRQHGGALPQPSPKTNADS
jgi:hypothetical protein